MMIERIAIIFLALAFSMVYWFCKDLDRRVNNLLDAYIHVSRAYEEQNERMEKLQAAVRDILKDVKPR